MGKGEKNKVSTEELLNVLNITRRELYSAIRNERRAGELILTDKAEGGYWLWDGENLPELERFEKMQRAGALDVLTTLMKVHEIIQERKAENGKG